MERQQQAPVQHPLLMNNRLTPVWHRFFQKLKIRDDETRRKPYKIYTADTTLTTWELGKTLLFDIGATDTTVILPQVVSKEKWAWIQIIRTGAGKLTITAAAGDRIEYSSEGGSTYCEEKRRRAANVTLQIIDDNQWAIIAGLGTWEVD